MRASQFSLAAEAADSVQGVSLPITAEEAAEAAPASFSEISELMLEYELEASAIAALYLDEASEARLDVGTASLCSPPILAMEATT